MHFLMRSKNGFAQLPIDVYDMATWMSIAVLSEQSLIMDRQLRFLILLTVSGLLMVIDLQKANY